MPTYKTFIRSATNWKEFANARKVTQETGLSFAQAKQRCADFKANRTARQIRRGTMMEFTAE